MIGFYKFAVLTLRDPVAAVERLRALNPTMGTRMMAVVLAASLSTLLVILSNLLFPVQVETPLSDTFEHILARPLALASVQTIGLLVAAWLMAVLGRIFGGRGQFADALLVVVWIQILLIAVQMVQTVMMLLFPMIGALMGLLIAGLLFYLPVRLAAALHGFSNLFLVFLCFIPAIFLLGMILTPIASLFGVLPEIAPNDL